MAKVLDALWNAQTAILTAQTAQIANAILDVIERHDILARRREATLPESHD